MEPLTLDLSEVTTLDDETLYRLCVANRDVRFERTPDQRLLVMSPTGGETGARNVQIIAALADWNEKTKRGIVFDSSTGFLLKNKAMRSPDASWVTRERWAALSDEERERFPPLCPDFVVELRSPSDHLKLLEGKMDEWMTNGCRLAWLINPIEEQAVVYRADGTQDAFSFDAVLSGEEVLPGFELDLSRLQ